MSQRSFILHAIGSGLAEGAVIGVFAGGLFFAATWACGAPDVVRCQLDAIVRLPRDPEQVTLAQAREAAAQLRRCEAATGKADAGHE